MVDVKTKQLRKLVFKVAEMIIKGKVPLIFLKYRLPRDTKACSLINFSFLFWDLLKQL